MEDQKAKVNRAVAKAWRKAWSNREFRIKSIIGSIAFLCLLLVLPYFFGMVEQRHGVVLHDRLLELIPPVDVSGLTFIIIWAVIGLLLVRCVQDPSIFIVAFISLILLFVSRMVTILLFPLDPPVGLIPLIDPMSSMFYGGPHVFITKDLFYSGHTSTQFMIYLCVTKKSDKRIAMASSIIVAALVLIQHVHYTIDVAAAFVFTYLIYLLGKKIANTN
jgi:hypothetical protein